MGGKEGEREREERRGNEERRERKKESYNT